MRLMINRNHYFLILLGIGLFAIPFSPAYAATGTFDVLDNDVDYDIEGGEIVDMYLDVDFVEIIIDFVAAEDGLLELDIPRGLLDAKLSESEDDIFFVIVDGFETEYIEVEASSTSRTLVIPFFAGDEQLEIIGTDVLLEIELPPEIEIPDWIKNNAKFWADDAITDTDFVNGIKYLITNGLMTIPETESGESSGESIPTWVKQNAGWWADGAIADSDFVSGIQYLITKGIMTI